ncbi:MAG: RimK family alpha-L-glutamate ligase [Methylotenera sp.]|nr:RimK family alpha-L-glutamate ligase [Oligoflexia bacterium]
MRIAILSRNKNLHSIRRLLQEAMRFGVDCDIINPLDCQLVVDGKETRILVGSNPLPEYDAILPRIGASITDYGLAVVKHFESLDTFVVNGSRAIAESRDKMRSLQVMAKSGICVPSTVLCRSGSGRGTKAAVKAVGGMPVVLKVLRGTQGVGVMLIHTPVSLNSVLDTLNSLEEDVIMQQFIAEGAGRDYRAFVIGNQVVAAMMRTAPEGEFRSNIHQGGTGKLVKLPVAFARSAIKAAQVFDLKIAGVDIMESKSGPMVIEVNSSPGFEGIEKATGMNVAYLIMKHLITEAKKIKKNKVRKEARKAARKTKPSRRARKSTAEKSGRKSGRKTSK